MTNRSNVSMFHIMCLVAIFVIVHMTTRILTLLSDYKAIAYKIFDKIAKLQLIRYCKFIIMQVLLLITHF